MKTNITGIELIAQERKEQLEKHNRTIQEDIELNKDVISIKYPQAAGMLLLDESGRDMMIKRKYTPYNWNQDQFTKMMQKSYKERLIIAGALLAAEIDRIISLEEELEDNNTV